MANILDYNNLLNTGTATPQNIKALFPKAQLPSYMTTPSPAPIPTPAPSNQGSSYQEQWSAAGHAGTAPVGYHGESSGGSGGIDQGAIDAIYKPQMDTLNSYENYYRNQDLPNTLSSIETNRTKLQGEADQEKQQTDLDTAAQKNMLGQSNQSALDQAYKQFSALQQGARARFGSGSSAGAAVSDLNNQELQRQTGGISQTYQNQLGSLLSKQTQLYTYISHKKSDIDQQSQDLIKQANDQFSQRLLQINASRGQLESAKAQAKLAVLQQAVDESRSIRMAAISAQLQLSTWQQEQEAALKTQYNTLNGQVVDTSSQPFTPYSNNSYITPSTKPTTTSTTNNPLQNYLSSGAGTANPLIRNPNEEQSLNPFT